MQRILACCLFQNILSAFQIVVNLEVEDPWTEAEGEEEVLVLGSRSNLRLCVGPTLFFAPATVEAPKNKVCQFHLILLQV